jgi:hypothetical protein
MNSLERDTAPGWHPITQHGDEPTVIADAEGSWLYDVDGNRVLYGALLATVPGGTVADATKGPSIPPPDPDQPSGPSPTDPEGPTDPKPTDPTDPTGPDEPPAHTQRQVLA